jgi:hypothetical protein
VILRYNKLEILKIRFFETNQKIKPQYTKVNQEFNLKMNEEKEIYRNSQY